MSIITKQQRMKELRDLIEYHEKNIPHIEALARDEEVPKYRADMYNQINRTRILLREWKEQLNELQASENA